MSPANPNDGTGAGSSSQNRHSTFPLSFKSDMLDPSSSTSRPIRIDGFESKSEFLTRTELLDRRARRVRQLARIYRDHYWALMEELKSKYREYCWEYGKSPFVDDEENGKFNSNCGDCTAVNGENISINGNLRVNGGNNSNINFKSNRGNFVNKCSLHGCKAKAMALTKFCHMHILSDPNQKLYKACSFTIKCSTTGPILCRKPILRSADPSYCAFHLQKAEKEKEAALRKVSLNVSSINKLALLFFFIVVEYLCQNQNKRKAPQKAKLGSSS
ncbi:hypothetical protein ACJIZ3_008663 [Penstemon smallii]|uniref:KAT8 regulatory NSL complex subunit 2 n=1 Tax=Penstemon smallii TaxID=265156 RepID=A0ABD3TAD7_9LAMI